MLFPCTSVWSNTLAWVPHLIQPYLMVLDIFRQCNFKCTICIRCEKLDMLKHYSTPEPLNYLTDGPSGFCARFTEDTRTSLLTAFVCFFILFYSCCSHVRLFGKTPVHEFHSSYSHTDWHFFFKRHYGNGRRVAWQKLTILIIILYGV